MIVCELNLCVSLLSGRSVSWSDHGVPTSPTTLLSQALLWTLQTAQPGTLPGRPGGRTTCTRILTAHTSEQMFVCYSSSVWPLCYYHIWAARAPPSISNNSSSWASYILTWHVKPSSRITVATYTQSWTESSYRKRQKTFQSCSSVASLLQELYFCSSFSCKKWVLSSHLRAMGFP